MPTKLELLRKALEDYDARGSVALPAFISAARQMCPATFTVMTTGLSKEAKSSCPTFVLWSVVAPYASQAMRNHSQTLERLNERGGCSPVEIYAIVHGLSWGKQVDPVVALEWLKSVS